MSHSAAHGSISPLSERFAPSTTSGTAATVSCTIAPIDGPGDDGEEIRIQEEDGEEEPARYVPDPGQPSEKEEEEHRCTHLPFRKWCRWCMMGRGLGEPHARTGSSSAVPRVGLDYFFMTRVSSAGETSLMNTGSQKRRRRSTKPGARDQL